MPETRLAVPINWGPWPDVANARLFLSQMVEGHKFSRNLPDVVQLTEWLDQLELGAFAYTYFKNWDDPKAQIASKHLKTSYWAGVAASSIKIDALQQILREFLTHGIDSALVKGMAFELTIYADHAVRPMNDIDIWIRKSDLPVVRQLIKTLGYQEDEAEDLDQVAEYELEWSFYPDKPQISKWNIEVHWDLLPRPGLMGRLPLEEWWQRRRRVNFQGLEVMVLDPADALVHACTHQLLQHGNQIRLRWLLDIDRLIRGRGDYVISAELWQRLWSEYHKSEMWPVITAGIQLAAHWFATPLSDQVREMIAKPLSVDQQLFYLFYGVPNMTVGERMIINFQGPNSVTYRVQMMLRFLFPRPKYMMERYAVAHWVLLPFYYGARIVKGMVRFLDGR